MAATLAREVLYVHLLFMGSWLRSADMLDVRKLGMLAELDRSGTITATAEVLGLSPPAVSMQLAALEKQLGLALTERHGRRVVLTPAGRLLARHGHDIVEMVTVAELEATALREGAAGTYRLAAFPTAVRTFVADVLRELHEAPDTGLAVRLAELEPQEAVPAVAAGDVELAVTHAYSNIPDAASPTLVARPLATEPLYLATRADDPLVAGPSRPRDLAAFAHHNWIVSDRRWTCFEMVRRACGLAGFDPRTVAEVTDYGGQLALVAAGVGVALVPGLAVPPVPAGVRLHALATPVWRHLFTVTRRASAHDPGLARLQDRLADAAARVVADA
jgi:DNA-binding transcriptional LysR family regulator